MAARSGVSAVLALAVLLSACANSGVASPGGDSSGAPVPASGLAEHAYDGPLHFGRGGGAHPDAGAAGQVVHCNSWGDGGSVSTVPYAEGATTDRPEQALDEEGIFGGGPRDGVRVAKETDDRVLYVLDVNGVVKEAVIVHNGPATDGAGGPGWYVESWAVCDSSELPRAYTDSIGLQIWTDSSDQPLPTPTIQSWRGPEHCDWQSMTFLELGKATYVRDPQPDLAGYFTDPYLPHSELPPDAVDTGYHHDGQKLWLSADKQLAYVGTITDVEVWPRQIKPLLCQ